MCSETEKKASLAHMDWVKVGEPIAYSLSTKHVQGKRRPRNDKLKESEKVVLVELLMEERCSWCVST